MTDQIKIECGAEISIPLPPEGPARDELRDSERLSFPNPEYSKRKRLNLYLGKTPERVTAGELRGERLYFPRGCLRTVADVLVDAGGYTVAVDFPVDETPGAVREATPLADGFQLRDYQAAAVEAVAKTGLRCDLSRPGGVVVLPPGSGKTVIGCAIAGRLALPTLVIVHTKDLLAQWLEAFEKVLGVEAGWLGGGRKANIKRHTVAMIQTLARQDELKIAELGNRFGIAMIDEVHHVVSDSFQKVVRALHCRWRVGLTATPKRDDGMTPLLYWTMGPEVYRAPVQKLVEKGHLVLPSVEPIRTASNPIPDITKMSCSICLRHWEVPTEDLPREVDGDESSPYQYADLPCEHCLEKYRARLKIASAACQIEEGKKAAARIEDAYTSAKTEPNFAFMLAELTEDEERNFLICRIAASEALAGRSVLILSGRKDHCHWLAAVLRLWGHTAEAVDSGVKTKIRPARIQALRDGELSIMCATSLADEGLDVPALDVVILSTPQKAPGRLAQRVGRVMRPSHAPTVYDIVDADNELAVVQWYQRRAAYKRELGVTPRRLAVFGEQGQLWVWE